MDSLTNLMKINPIMDKNSEGVNERRGINKSLTYELFGLKGIWVPENFSSVERENLLRNLMDGELDGYIIRNIASVRDKKDPNLIGTSFWAGKSETSGSERVDIDYNFETYLAQEIFRVKRAQIKYNVRTPPESIGNRTEYVQKSSNNEKLIYPDKISTVEIRIDYNAFRNSYLLKGVLGRLTNKAYGKLLYGYDGVIDAYTKSRITVPSDWDYFYKEIILDSKSIFHWMIQKKMLPSECIYAAKLIFGDLWAPFVNIAYSKTIESIVEASHHPIKNLERLKNFDVVRFAR